MVNGLEQPANQTIDVLATDLDQAVLVAASAPDPDMLWVRAFDGTTWSCWHEMTAASLA